MNTTYSSLLAGVILGGSILAPSLLADERPRIVDRPTIEQLQERQARQKATIERKRAKASGGKTETRAPRKKKPADLVSRSTILSHGGYWTIVPKGAVLHTPERLRTRVGVAQPGRFLAWTDFYAKNRGWIHLQTVQMRQARGEQALPEGVDEAYPKIGRVVVAVCHGGPISVRPYEDPEKAPAASGEGEVVPVHTR